MGKNKKSNSVSKATRDSKDVSKMKLLDRIKPIIKENDRISEQFLLRNYDTVFSSSVQLLKTIFNLQFSYENFEYSSNFLVDIKPNVSIPDELTFLELWFLIFNPKFPLACLNQDKLQLPLDFLPVYNVWTNAWSYIFTIICKINEKNPNNNYSQLSEVDITSAPLVIPFSSEFKVDCNTKFDALEKDLISVWQCLSSIHGGRIAAIPSDLILGLMLITTKQENFLLAESIATTWINTIPPQWKERLAEASPSIDYSAELDPSAEPDQPLQKFYYHYDSIVNLLAAHVAVALHSTQTLVKFLTEDEVIPFNRKQVFTDRHHEAIQATLVTPTPHHEVKNQTVQRREAFSEYDSQSTENIVDRSPNETLYSKLTNWFKSPTYNLSHYAMPSVMVVALTVFYFTNRRLSRNNSASSWWKVWLYRLLSSFRMALPSRSSGPNSI